MLVFRLKLLFTPQMFGDAGHSIGDMAIAVLASDRDFHLLATRLGRTSLLRKSRLICIFMLNLECLWQCGGRALSHDCVCHVGDLFIRCRLF